MALQDKGENTVRVNVHGTVSLSSSQRFALRNNTEPLVQTPKIDAVDNMLNHVK
jgi:hypothetical protein